MMILRTFGGAHLQLINDWLYRNEIFLKELQNQSKGKKSQIFKREIHILQIATFTLLHSEWPKLHRVLAVLSAKGLRELKFRIAVFKYQIKQHVLKIL